MPEERLGRPWAAKTEAAPVSISRRRVMRRFSTALDRSYEARPTHGGHSLGPRAKSVTLLDVRSPAAAAVACLLSVVALGGCGSDDAPGPAALVPKESIVYG